MMNLDVSQIPVNAACKSRISSILSSVNLDYLEIETNNWQQQYYWQQTLTGKKAGEEDKHFVPIDEFVRRITRNECISSENETDEKEVYDMLMSLKINAYVRKDSESPHNIEDEI